MATSLDSEIDRTIVPNGSRTIEIDRRGDVLLEVGGDQKMNLLVSSKILSLASDMFRALFEPHFKEGTEFVEKKSGELHNLRLVDDDPKAMETLCYIIHQQNQPSHQAYQQVDVDAFLEFAILCDKYGCTEGTRLFTNAWFKALQPTKDISGLQKILTAGYFLDDPSRFRRVSKQLILDSKDSFLKVSQDDDVYELLPIKVYILMENERAKLRQTLEKGLQSPIDVLIRKEKVYAGETTADKSFGAITHTWHSFGIHDSFVTSAYLRELRILGVWPLDFQNIQVGAVLEKLATFQEKEISSSSGFRVFGRDPQCQACLFDSRTHIAKLITKVVSEVQGVCMDCVRKIEYPSFECRLKHN